MKLTREIKLPNSNNIDVSLKLGDEDLSFSIKPKNKVDKELLKELDKKMDKEHEAPKKYAELVEKIDITKELISSYKKKIEKESKKTVPSKKNIEKLEEKLERELELLQQMVDERDEIGQVSYNPEPIFEEKCRLFCAKGIEALEKHAEIFSWRETAHLVGSILLEAEEGK